MGEIERVEKPKKKSEIIQEQIDKMNLNLKNLEEKQAKWLASPTSLKTLKTEEHKHDESVPGHKSLKEIVDCPNCREQLKAKFEPEIFAGFKEKVKKQELWKSNTPGCNELVGKDENECPTCHGTEAQPI